jgi:hypothetical protein
VEKHRNHKIDVEPAKIGGGNTTGAILGFISNLFDITNTATMMKRESPPLDYGFVTVA